MTDYPITFDGNIVTVEQMRQSKKKKPPKKKLKLIDINNVERFNPAYNEGLNDAQVAQRNDEGLYNKTVEKSGKTYKSILFSNIFTFFNLLTFGVAIALIAVGAAASQLFFMIIIITNIIIATVLEFKSKYTVSKLSLITAPTAIVIRKGARFTIPITEVVLDDIIFLELGKQICADAVVVKGEIEVNESLLTGESVPVAKKAGSLLYSGSFVSSGNCYAKVEKVGSQNYIETLTSHAKRYVKPKSELINSVRGIIKAVTVFIVPISAAMIYLTLEHNGYLIKPMVDSVSGAVIGMIPAGMFLLITVALAMSLLRLGKKKILVQDLHCIEMLARVNVLCLDKTGTITDGTMQVNNVIEIKGGETEQKISDVIGSMLTATQDNNQTALALANKFGYSQKLNATTIIPFSSKRKLSAVTFENAGTFMLGAPEFVLKDLGTRIEKIVEENAENGYRVLCLAHSTTEIKGEKLPVVRRPIALIVIEDHIRDDAKDTIAWFKQNNVQVKVISGDNPITVSEVARRVGVENAELYISLDGLSNQDVIESANKYTVFGRVTPEQKSLLIKSIKAKGNTVAMTGDGVNDILAMRESDCAVSIASGAEAARNASHLVLQDSSFTAMPDVVAEGRRVVNNIQKSSSLFLMKTFMSITLSLAVLILAIDNYSYPFKTNNLLLLEVFVIAIPSTALALQSNKSIIKGKFLYNVFSQTIPGGLALLFNILAIYYFRKFVPQLTNGAYSITDSEYISMMVLALTFTGMMMLFKISQPLDAFRTVLLIITALTCTLAIIIAPQTFGIAKLGLMPFLFLSTMVLFSYFLISFFMTVFSKIRLYN